MRTRAAYRLGVVLLVVCVWEGAFRLLELPGYLFPSPLKVFEAAWDKRFLLVWHAQSTAAAAVLGLVAALAVGAAVSLLFTRFALAGALGEPVVGAAQTIPILAIAPLLTAWFGPGLAAKAAAAFIVSVPSVVVTLLGGLRSVRHDEVDLFRSMGATPWRIIWYLRTPRALPYLFVALRVASPLATLGSVVGEFVGAERGLGVMILRGSYYLRTSEMVAAVIAVGLLSSGLVALSSWIKRRLEWVE